MTNQIGCGLSQKSRQSNNVTNRISVILVEYDTELLRPIKQCAVYDEDEIGQQSEQSYNFFVHRIRN